MLSSRTRVATSSARRYLTQLCKHFAHRIPVSLAESHGRITFETGICTAADTTELERLRGVMARHLERFAFRETLVMRWEDTAEADAER